MQLVITGVPGTGKTLLSKGLAKRLGCKVFHANDIVKEKDLWEDRRKGTVNLKRLHSALLKEIGKEKDWIAEGHLLCEFPLPAQMVLVLRCRPEVLKNRLGARGYPATKTAENLWAELLDYCTTRAQDEYRRGRVIELDNTKFHTAQSVLAVLSKGNGSNVDWSAFLRQPERLKALIGSKRRL